MQPDESRAKLIGVIPLNRLDRAKSRLASALAPSERVALVLWLAERALAALVGSGMVDRVAVVSPDDDALAWAEAHNAIPLRQTTSGLNAGLALARNWATERDADGLLIALGDLPTLTCDEVRRFVAMTRLYDTVIGLAPDRARAGTNLLLARPAAQAPIAYGRGSFARHQRLAKRAGLPLVEFSAPGAAFDVDTPADLYELLARGLWTLPSASETAEPSARDAQKERA